MVAGNWMRPRRRRSTTGIVRPQAVFTATMVAVISALLMVLVPGVAGADGVTPTSTWVDLYSSHSTMAGVPIPVGAAVAVFDPQGTRCGEQTVTIAGRIAPVMPCYGDDPLSAADEGPRHMETLHFTLNGLAVVPQAVSHNFEPVSPDTPVTWANQDLWEINLYLPPRPVVGVTLESGELRLEWPSAGPDVTVYEIWRATRPYFAPGEPGSEQPGAVTPTGSLTWSGAAGVGDSEVNYTYRVHSVNQLTQTVGFSQAVGEFDFSLYR
jgi:hypothetical protein